MALSVAVVNWQTFLFTNCQNVTFETVALIHFSKIGAMNLI
jgi:hypothetical protein